MGNKSKWKSKIWKSIVSFSVILGVVASSLQISGTMDLGNLLALPLYSFLSTEIKTYHAVLFTIAILIVLYLATKLKHRKGILEYVSARAIVSLCEIPKTTESLKRDYYHWHRGWIAGGEPSFYEFVKRLEKKGFLQYDDGKWQASPEALNHVKKYEGKN
jgi:hypothetical protein